MVNAQIKPTEFSAWNPGLEQDIPAEYRELETIYRSENVITRLAAINELAKRTGLSAEELVVFRPERLAMHELIVRITADIAIREEEEEEALGLHFRQIANTILASYISPHMAEIQSLYDNLHNQVYNRVQQELSTTLFVQPVHETAHGFSFFGLFKKKKKAKTTAVQESIQEREYRIIASYKDKGLAAEKPLDIAIYKSLYQVLGSIASTHGYVGSDLDMLTELITGYVCNGYGSRVIGRAITPYIESAIRQEGFTLIPYTKTPMLISLKGASAAGKSSLRPMLKQMMKEQGIEPDSYGTISPDIWRRLLLDYEALGNAYKYAGRLTSNEVNIIDSKLDRYIRSKAKRHCSIPHLLVDRFRFDSFSSEKISRILHDTYAKYVDTMWMYFVITPPEATVERGWERGLARGRYKTVEDFLGHSVEAYVGIPKLLFKWLVYNQPLFKYVFLDNSVPKGTCPKTIAYGTQKKINIINPLAFINIERYQKINIKAKTPEQVYPEASVLSIANNIGFLKQCIQKIPVVNFEDETSHEIYASTESGNFQVLNKNLFDKLLTDKTLAQIFSELTQ
ncbi:hypothetical protein [Motiliproteus sp. MSK22-1]|uniref:hypothetical protein n=1 Tax=Motiliproteus sp. MSK22-1 TaxID=1897630 RepID=UPI0009780279|nr:hypothetical protein [Motiliproteus sp. MSK22-1]OMH38173.1 hypothetical protein BGP75_07890 [Motiliproteus sp. MSK22-1]